MGEQDEWIAGTIDQTDPGLRRQLVALGGVILTVALSVLIAALETAGWLSFDAVLRVSGFVSPMIAAAMGGVLYGRR